MNAIFRKTRILTFVKATSNVRLLASYKQGQNDPIKSKIREYFYYIDHNGMV